VGIGRIEEARMLLKELLELVREVYVPATSCALGESETAFDGWRRLSMNKTLG
jgi:hypothetical protein